MSTLLAVALLWQARSPAGELQEAARRALDAGQRPAVEALFADRSDARYVFAMAARRGGLARLAVTVFPSPPGWKEGGDHWVVFHTFQDIEQDHDPVYETRLTPRGLRLGPEVPEWRAGGRIRHASTGAHLRPSEGKVDVRTELAVEGEAGRSALFRLNDIYRVDRVTVDGNEVPLVTGQPGAATPSGRVALRAGGLLAIGPLEGKHSVEVKYSGRPNAPEHDRISERLAYVTAWWVPSLGRLPFTTRTTVVGPASWVLRSEGVEGGEAAFQEMRAGAGEQIRTWSCEVPISYPKVLGGAYRLAAEGREGRHVFRAYQMDETWDEARAKRDVERMRQGMRFFEEKLGPFPFAGYECYDGLGYYGIESYSHTILTPTITTRYVTHEIGHTYFGGLVPSAYVRDTWNEGVTTYVDDLLLLGNDQEVLGAGLATMRFPTPLNRMSVAWDLGGASYYRGAYVMRMLEKEIGLDAVLRGLRRLIRERPGKDTVWADLRPAFEQESGRKLDWFWRQWVEQASYPALRVVRQAPAGNGRARVTVRQSGTATPFRLRFSVRAPESTIVTMTKAEETFVVKARGNARARLDVFGLTLARTN